MTRVLPALIGALIVTAAVAERAEAIPAFARKYKTSCMTCHVVFPKLNDFGETFRRNGFKIPEDDEFFVKDEPIVLGAKAWKLVWPKSVWPSDLPHLPPIAFLTRFTLSAKEGGDRQGNLAVPDEFTLLAAGTLGEDIGFFVHSGAGARFYATFNDLVDGWLGENSLNLKVGLFEPDIVALTNVRRLSITPSLFSSFDYDLASGNGSIFRVDRQIGLEFSGAVRDRFRWSLGVVQGDGDSPDSNEKKDFYYRFAYKFRGIDFTGSNLGEGEESLKQTDNWTDNSVTLGTFGYFGHATPDDVTLAGLNRYDVDVIRIGADVRLNWKDLDLIAGFVTGEDENADNTGADVGILLYYAEADYMLFPWLVGYARYEHLRFRGALRPQLRSDEVRRTVLGLNAAVRANVKITLEYVINDGGGGREGDDEFFLALSFVF